MKRLALILTLAWINISFAGSPSFENKKVAFKKSKTVVRAKVLTIEKHPVYFSSILVRKGPLRRTDFRFKLEPLKVLKGQDIKSEFGAIFRPVESVEYNLKGKVEVSLSVISLESGTEHKASVGEVYEFYFNEKIMSSSSENLILRIEKPLEN